MLNQDPCLDFVRSSHHIDQNLSSDSKNEASDHRAQYDEAKALEAQNRQLNIKYERALELLQVSDPQGWTSLIEDHEPVEK